MKFGEVLNSEVQMYTYFLSDYPPRINIIKLLANSWHCDSSFELSVQDWKAFQDRQIIGAQLNMENVYKFMHKYYFASIRYLKKKK